LAGLEVVLVHCAGLPQASVLAGHVHFPPSHVVPPEHTTPQAPQLLSSASESMHAPAQFASPAAHSATHVD